MAIQVAQQIESNNAREAWLKSLPKDAAEKIRQKDREKHDEEMKHRRALELAEAGRPRNFWGQ